MNPTTVKFMIDVARFAVALKQRTAVVELRRSVVKTVHVKQFEETEAKIVDAVAPMFDEQVRSIARSMLQGSRSTSPVGKNIGDVAAALVDQHFLPSEWDSELVDRTAPPMAIAMGEAMVASQMSLGHDPRKSTTASDWLAGRTDQAPLEEVVFSTPQGDVPMRIATEWPPWMKAEIKSQLQVTFSQPYWERVNQTTRSDVGRFIERGLAEGRSIEQMARDMEGELLQEGRYARRRARTIARTESGHALNGARRASTERLAADLGPDVSIKQAWLSVLGNTTRDTHAALDGDVEGDDGMWPLGGVRVPWPSHVALPARERANCQCTLVVEFGV